VSRRSTSLWGAIPILLAASIAGAQTSDMPRTGDALERAIVDPSLLPVRSPTAEDPLLRNPPPPIPGPVDPKVYRVGPGDLFQIQVSGRVSRNWLVQVGPEGYLLIPGSGSSMVSGRTLAEVRSELVEMVGRRFRGVNVEVRLARPRTFSIYLTGQVKTLGTVQALASSRVGDVLAEGAFLDNGSKRRIELTHKDGTREYADLTVFNLTGDQSANPWLRDGDVINVPVASEWVWAQGALGRPQHFELGLHDSLLTLFHLAGNPLPAAEVDRVLLVRWADPGTAESLWVRLDEVYGRRTNPALRDGDRLYVYYLPQYHLQHEVNVLGEVSRPGVYPIQEGQTRLSDLVSAAGGFLPTADLSAIRVHRRTTSNERDQELERLLKLPREQLTASEYAKLTTGLASLREDYRIDWKRLNSAPANLDLLLRDGDAVYVERLVSSIRVDGEVRRPGILTYRSGQKLDDYLKQSGGMTDRAWASRIRVTRAVTGQTLPARNVRTLDPGDFVWVPERPDKSVWDYGRETLTAVAQIATVVIAIRSVK
jgi:protein involved in polysaccharide export with SLBB domain